MREPAVSGQFYPSTKEEIDEQLSQAFAPIPSSESAGVVSPHAGYIYSGLTAAHAFSNLGPADTYIILGPSHKGMASELSVSLDNWMTPLGTSKTDQELASIILEKTSAEHDELAHRGEHSIEVQLPFLQFRYAESKIVPICMMQSERSPAFYEEFGKQLAGIVQGQEKSIKVIASSDFSHHMPEAAAKQNDEKAIEHIKSLDVAGFIETIFDESISICGFGPIAALMSLSKSLGIKKAELLKYDTSATASGDHDNVVGYAAIAFRNDNPGQNIAQ